jgi:hypothetical protein
MSKSQPTSRQFHISDILSVSTGALLSSRRMDDIHDIMRHIVGDDGISTIGLAANAEEARQFLEKTIAPTVNPIWSESRA